MISRKKLLMLLGLLILAGLALAACGTGDGGTAEVIIRTVEVPGPGGETIIVTVEVPVGEQPPAAMTKDDPSTLVLTTFGGPGSLDPAWNYETAGNTAIMNIYETLIFYNRGAASEFIPQLATDWTISDDGLTYTFTMREGVQFHNGDTMTAEDAAWSLQRGVLQGGGWSPQWLMTEPIFGIGVYDVAELVDPEGALVDDREGLVAADADALLAACEAVTSAFVADGNTVTITLAQPWGPMLGTLAGGFFSVVDKAWAVEQGAWDGDCATWQNYYSVDDETAPLTDIMNGTGPYMLDHWIPGEEKVLVRNENYWRTEPGWEGGPSGVASIETIVVLYVDEWGTRFAMVQAGDADLFDLGGLSVVSQVDPFVGEECNWDASIEDFTCELTDNPNGPLRVWLGAPGVSRSDALMTFDINVEGGNGMVGSGEMDGNGIPPDFFNDLNVRRAFNYCFDFETYIAEAQNNEAVRGIGVLIPGMLGWDDDGAKYDFDLEKCQEEIELAWGGAVAENGFRMQIAFNTGNTSRQTAAAILQSNFRSIDPKYQIEIVGLPWPAFLSQIRASRIPVFVSGWLEDIHDPHNWVGPFTTGTYAYRQQMPEEMIAQFSEYVDAGVGASDPAERHAIYLELQQFDYDSAPAIRLSIRTGHRYEQRWVQGYYFNPVYPGSYYYSLSISQ
ncbi:MAG: ABC transporter substrate-binding protein [Chloroflexi bacterium]|nr:ABC transporter substrate-binding protein [Chloroflexota bacterium]